MAGHTTGQPKAQRGRISLKAAEGKHHAESARELNPSIEMVRWWRRRWGELEPLEGDDLSAEQRLDDLARPGAPARFSADPLGQIEPVAGEGPEQAGRPIRQWTGGERAAELGARGLVESISARQAARLLKKGDCSRTGCAPI